MVLGLSYNRGELSEFNKDDALQEFDQLVRGKNNLHSKMVSSELLQNKWLILLQLQQLNEIQFLHQQRSPLSMEIMISHHTDSHYMLYVMNKYRDSN